MSYYSSVNMSRTIFKTFSFVNTQSAALSSDFTTGSTSFTDITGLSVTISNRTNGKWIGRTTIGSGNSTANANTITRWDQNGTPQEGYTHAHAIAPNTSGVTSITGVGTLDGNTVKLEGKVSAGTGSWDATDADETSRFDILELATGKAANLATAEVNITSDFSTASTSFIDVTGLTMSKTNHTLLPRFGFVVNQLNVSNATFAATLRSRFNDDGATDTAKSQRFFGTAIRGNCDMALAVDPDGATIKVEGRTTAGTSFWRGATADQRCAIKMISFAGDATHISLPEVTITSDFSTSSTHPAYVDVTGMTITRSNITGGTVFCIATLNCDVTPSSGTQYTRLIDDTTPHAPQITLRTGSNFNFSKDIAFVGATDAKVIKIQLADGAGTTSTRVLGANIDQRSKINLIEVKQ